MKTYSVCSKSRIFCSVLVYFAYVSLANANDELERAGRCAVNYLQVGHAQNASQTIKQYEQIDTRERAWHLIRTYQLNPSISGSGNNFAVDLNRFVQGQSNSLQLGVNGNVVLFPEASIKDDLDS